MANKRGPRPSPSGGPAWHISNALGDPATGPFSVRPALWCEADAAAGRRCCAPPSRSRRATGLVHPPTSRRDRALAVGLVVRDEATSPTCPSWTCRASGSAPMQQLSSGAWSTWDHGAHAMPQRRRAHLSSLFGFLGITRLAVVENDNAATLASRNSPVNIFCEQRQNHTRCGTGNSLGPEPPYLGKQLCPATARPAIAVRKHGPRRDAGTVRRL